MERSEMLTTSLQTVVCGSEICLTTILKPLKTQVPPVDVPLGDYVTSQYHLREERKDNVRKTLKMIILRQGFNKNLKNSGIYN